MDKTETLVKNRDLTEKKILDAVGEIITECGFEKVGINAVAQRANISKMLIYRYFGSIDELIMQYILKYDYWINIPTDAIPEINNLGDFLKELFRQQINQLRKDVALRRLCRWELSTDNPVTAGLREQREKNGSRLVEVMSKLTAVPQDEVAALASVLSASISYLAMLEELCPVYNGISIQSDAGWEQLAKGIDTIIDLWINNLKQ
ncbi:TetR/AcrR family transcriptional regulator [uncultured Bacteroides sp.]|uniref:TetR/AcrR family transcriptional regulator n=1 Tax=uncultured Bacteroides sp. TaxID=162156 RepID=UPI002AABB628|nr:TetR/AcrR family transcriptional regulator [uncultured Bacteroides sp.]